MPEYRLLEAGDPAPWFRQRSTANPVFNFDTAAGRYIVLCFHASAADAQGKAMLSILTEHRALFDDRRISFFGVSVDPADEREGRVAAADPGIRFFWDFDGQVSRAYGAAPTDPKEPMRVRRFWIVLDPTLRILATFDAKPDASERHEVARMLAELPEVDAFPGFPIQAPILVLPNVFEPALCELLVSLYEQNGGVESGFMREVDGKTVAVTDHAHKRRADYQISDQETIRKLQERIRRRVVPEIRKVHQFEVTRMERYIVSCYDSATGGHFRAHRDNTTKGTAHRRFAVSINLNEDFEGGEVSFPEYGPRSFKAPTGGAVVFSCSLLHAVSPVRAGRRFAFLPFLYDEAAAKLREENLKFVDPALAGYKADTAKAG